MLQAPGAFFIGTVHENEKKYLKTIFENALKNGYTRFIEPCGGYFAMAQLAVQAGFKPEQIETSDVTFYSSVLGYAYMGKPLDDLQIEADGFTDEELKDPATVLYAHMYLKQTLNSGHDYYHALLEDLRLRREEHVCNINKQIEAGRSQLKGFSYQPLDMFDHINEVKTDEKAIIVCCPPTYKAGYEKWFDTGGKTSWKEPDYRIFEPGKGHEDLFETMDKEKALFICYEEGGQQRMRGKAVFARYGVRKGINVYLTANREEEAEFLGNGKVIVRPNESKMSPLECSVIPSDHEITEKSKIELLQAEPQHTQYYRSIWTHNFVGSMAQINMVMLIDRYVAGVFGYQLAIGGQLFDDIQLTYAIKAPTEYRLGKLLTMIACNKETLKTVLSDYHFSRIRGIQTTNMTRYPESKEMRGVMKLAHREKGILGYKLIYKSELKDRSAEEALTEFLQKEETWKKQRSSRKGQK